MSLGQIVECSSLTWPFIRYSRASTFYTPKQNDESYLSTSYGIQSSIRATGKTRNVAVAFCSHSLEENLRMSDLRQQLNS